MKLNIVQQKDNPLFDRREIVANVQDTEATPSRKQLQEELCKTLSCTPETLVINRVAQAFGKNACTVTASVYASAEKATKYEKAYKNARTAGKAKEAKA